MLSYLEFLLKEELILSYGVNTGIKDERKVMSVFKNPTSSDFNHMRKYEGLVKNEVRGLAVASQKSIYVFNANLDVHDNVVSKLQKNKKLVLVKGTGQMDINNILCFTAKLEGNELHFYDSNDLDFVYQQLKSKGMSLDRINLPYPYSKTGLEAFKRDINSIIDKFKFLETKNLVQGYLDPKVNPLLKIRDYFYLETT